ncbi:MAG: ATP synthase F1 subunit epsilon [Chloroflexi bacterium]|nr:ATP synthase F1 subunit epsilon [Chloroflexota bacterium]
MPIRCEIITQERLLFDEQVDLVIAPASAGEMTILPQHAPVVAQLDFGELVVRTGDTEEYFAIGGGVLQVANDHILVLADSAEQADEIDISRAEEARQRAQQIMEEGVPGDAADYAALQASLKRANLLMKVGRRRQRTQTGAMRTAQFSDRSEDE